MVAQRKKQLVTLPEKKVVFCGGDLPKENRKCRVGKSSIVNKLIMVGSIADIPTVGVDVHPLYIVKDSIKYTYSIWDIGSFHVGDYVNEYFKKANYVFICYNSTKTKHLAETYWKDKVPNNAEIFYIDTNNINISNYAENIKEYLVR